MPSPATHLRAPLLWLLLPLLAGLTAAKLWPPPASGLGWLTVRCKWVDFPDGGGRNYLATPSLARAIRVNKKLKRGVRQIDVRVGGKEPYVLHNSWL
jgi:hypothetical protein